MGLEVQKCNNHDVNYPLSDHHTSQIHEEVTRQLKRLGELSAKMYKIRRVTSAYHNHKVAFPGETYTAQDVLTVLNELRSTKNDLNNLQDSLSLITQRTRSIQSAIDTQVQTRKES